MANPSKRKGHGIRGRRRGLLESHVSRLPNVELSVATTMRATSQASPVGYSSPRTTVAWIAVHGRTKPTMRQRTMVPAGSLSFISAGSTVLLRHSFPGPLRELAELVGNEADS
jgi:hypothetical protein